MRFYWKEEPVKEAVKGLGDREMRRKAKAAYEFLKHSEDSAYGKFVREHTEFLRGNPETERPARRRRLAFLEEPGSECALWPCLFWRLDQTFSNERATDPRRQRCETLEEALRPAARLEAGEEEGAGDAEVEGEDGDLVRHSIKRLYGALALGCLLGYTEHFEILQYVYDLHLWTDLGSKRSLGRGVPMRLMMAGSSFSPIYWKRVQNGLVDLVRQVGFPKFFWTLAPSEWTLPYHEFIKDGMAKALRGRLRLPVEETLHIAHVLLQTAKGFLLGDTGARKDWTDHLFKVQDETGQGRRLHGFLRLEFQDGTRKKETQEYHGSGRPHVHLLIFGDDDLVRTLDMPGIASATMPENDEDLAGYVKGSQIDHKQDSGRGVFEEETRFVEEAGAWKLKHLEEDHETGLRGYLVDVLDALKSRQDFLIGEDKIGMLRQYITKYLSKFSDAASQDWLNDDADAVSIATTVLSRYHPLEPEMVLQLFGAKFRQWHFTTIGGGKRDFVVPLPDVENLSERHEVRRYEAAAWARGKISLLDFLRKTNAEGGVSAWLKKKHAAQAEPGEALEQFAARYKMQGEKVVAADMGSRLGDKFYGQWLTLNMPFKKLNDFVDEEQLKKVPPQHRYLTMALLHGYGQNTEEMDLELKIEGHSRKAAQSIKDMLAANKTLIEDYLAGRVAEEAPAAAAEVGQNAAAAARMGYNRQQRRFKEVLDEAVDRALRGRSEDAAEVEEAQAQARAEARALVCMGPPGTGKTTVCHVKIEELLANSGKVLFALPTAQLASRMRERYGRRAGLDIDTCHAAFGLNEVAAGELPFLVTYDLIVVDEVSQLTAQHSDRILRLWEAADKLPALVFVGDRWQMSGFGDQRPWQSNHWKRATFKTEFIHSYRCQDPEFEKLLKQLRTSKPDKKTLRQLQRRKAWGPPGPPTPEGLSRLLHAHPNTTIVACSRAGAEEVNLQGDGCVPHEECSQGHSATTCEPRACESGPGQGI